MQVMSVLWQLKTATVAQLKHELDDLWEPEMAYTTVLTYLRSLQAKGWVRALKGQRAFRYQPSVTQSEARNDAVFDLADVLFEGRREELLRWLVEDARLKRPMLERARRIIEARLGD